MRLGDIVIQEEGLVAVLGQIAANLLQFEVRRKSFWLKAVFSAFVVDLLNVEMRMAGIKGIIKPN